MRLMPLHMVKPGMKLGKRISDEDGITLLGEQTELTQNLINRLRSRGVDYVYIDDPRTRDLVIRDTLSDETRSRALTEIRHAFRGVMDDQIKRKFASSSRLGQTFRGVMDLLLDDLLANRDAMIMLTNISVMDQYLYQHSLNVCVYTTMLGMSHGYSREQLMTLGLGAPLHDVGKTQIPPESLRKKEPLTDSEYEVIKKHAEYGYRLLKDEPNIPLLSAHCALQHHERLDGSGYPRGLKGDEIHEFARWIGLADSYDAMTTHRAYRSAMLPHQAMEILFTGTGTLYEKRMIEMFRDRIAIYPLGLTVKLNTGETGVVVGINEMVPQRPVVRIIQDAYGQEVCSPTDVDLSEKLSLMITGVSGGTERNDPVIAS
ncbi:HD-GYP domain-containing protein [Paenibacillus sp. P25]|nr:HD-GYP domain-containing protein [Paenibacillus sp. P25]